MPELRHSVVEVLNGSGGTAGTGFLVSDGLVLTCAHVVTGGAPADNGPPSASVYVRFLSGNGDAAPTLAEIVPSAWRGPADADVAVLRLAEPTPIDCRPLRLAGRAAGGRQVQAYGFPVNAPEHGHYGYAVLGDRVDGNAGQPLVQLRECTEITEGFSGAPAVDTQTGLVLGMVDSVAAPDRLQRGVATAYLTPAETLRSLVPGLVDDEDLHPYRGLGSFTAEDREWFFGREAAVAAVLDRFAGGAPPVVALLGPSGTGKTSLVQAGVLPALAEGGLPGSRRWAAVCARPGSDPWAEMARIGLGSDPTLAASVRDWRAGHPEAERLVLVLDQFEEIFSSRAATTERTRFLTELTALAHDEPGVTVLLVMRDDFYSQLAASAPALMDLLAGGIVNVPPVLTRSELAAIVTEPAHRAGGSFEPGLVDDIVADAVATAAAERGTEGSADSAPTTVLPLLEFALTELWESSDGWLTRDCYRRIGRLAGALASRCDAAFEELPEAQQMVAQRLLVHLVEDPGERGSEAPLSRRRIRLSELPVSLSDNPATRDAASALADRRLLVSGREATTGEPTYELIHDSLLRHWRRLREWLEGDVVFRSWRSRLESNYAEWRDSETTRGAHDADLLLRGHAAAYAGEQLAARRDDLSEDLVTYVEASTRADQRRRVRDRRRVKVLAGLLAVMTVLAGVALDQRRKAVGKADVERADKSRQLATEAVVQLRNDPEAGLLRARLAYDESDTPQAEAAVRQAVRDSRVRAAFRGHKSAVYSAAYEPNGKWVASGGADHAVRIWRAQDGHELRRLGGHEDAVRAVAVRQDGLRLASADGLGVVQVWDTKTWTRVARLQAGTVTVLTMAFSKDGTWLVTGGDDKQVRVFQPEVDGTEVAVMDKHTGPVTGAAFNPDGDVVATVSEDLTLRIWRWTTGEPSVVLRPHAKNSRGGGGGVAFSPDGEQIVSGEGWDGLVNMGRWRDGDTNPQSFDGHNDGVNTTVFSPSGDRIASASKDGTVRVWDSTTGRETVRTLRGHVGAVYSAAFSPDGRFLVSAGEDGTARVWEWRTGMEPARPLSGHEGVVASTVFSPNGRYLASGGADSTVRIWDLETDEHVILRGAGGSVIEVAFSADGRQVASAGSDGTALVWEWQKSTDPVQVLQPQPEDPEKTKLHSVAFSPDPEARYVATAGADTHIHIWDWRTGGRQPVSTLSGHGEEVTSLTFDRSGDHLLSSSWDRTARLWEWRTKKVLRTFPDPEQEIDDAAFDPTGRLVVTSSFNGKVRVWDRERGREIVPLVAHTGVVSAARFDPTGRWIVTAGGGDGVVRVWDWRQPVTPVVFMELPGVIIMSVSVDRSGRRIAVASDRGLFVEDCEVCADADDLLRLAAERSTRELTGAEKALLLDPPSRG